MNKIFTKEQIQVLKEFEHDYHTTIHLKYKRNNTRADLSTMSDIYEECTGIKLSREFQCPQCQFNLVCRVGELYYASVAYWEAEDAKAEAEMQENTKDDETVQENTEVKAKRSYKKKKE